MSMEEYDLFTMMMNNEVATAPEKAVTVPEIVPAVNFEVVKTNGVTEANVSIQRLEHLIGVGPEQKIQYSAAYLEKKLELIRNAGAQCIAYGKSAVYPIRIRVQSIEGTKIKGVEQLLMLDGSVKASDCDNKVLDISEVVAIEADALLFFTKNPATEPNLVTNEAFLEYFNGLDATDREDFLVFATFFNSNESKDNYKVIDDPKSVIQVEAQIRRGKGSELGYWEANFAVYQDFATRKWQINYFGEECYVTFDEMNEMYGRFTTKLQANLSNGLAALSDFELVAYYKLNGYRVYLDFLTFEWCMKEVHSNKVMFVTRKELLDFYAVTEKWKAFSTQQQVSVNELERLNFQADRVRSKYLQPVQLKAFQIPRGSIYRAQDKYYELTGHRTYKVLVDDGKYVTVKPVQYERGEYVEVCGLESLKVPRKDVVQVQLGSERQMQFIPYAIPANTLSKPEMLDEMRTRYELNLSKVELQQFLALDLFERNPGMTQAGKELDFKLLAALASDTNATTYGKSGQFGGLFSSKSRDGSYYFYCTRSELDGYTKYAVPNDKAVLLKFDKLVLAVSKKEIIQIYERMFLAIAELDPSELTLPELILAYRTKGYDLRYLGVPTAFYLNGNVIHTTTTDVTNIDKTIEKVFS